MLKKADIQSLLDRLPEEIEASEFVDALATIPQSDIPEWQQRALIETTKRTIATGGNDISVLEKRLEEWRSGLSSQMKP